jgi:O-methyltransferase
MYGKEKLEAIVSKHPDSFPAVKLLENFQHFTAIHDVISGKWIYGWGSYLFDGISYSYNEKCLKKQEELYRYSMSAKHVLELGVYTGHSLLLMLISNPSLNITAIDIDDTIAGPVVKYLNSVFGDRINFIKGDAVEVMKSLPHDTYDLIHIDADHNDVAVTTQFFASLPLAKKDSTIIFDDYDALQKSIHSFIDAGYLQHIVTPNCLWRNCVTRLIAKTRNEAIVNISKKYSCCSIERLKFNIFAVKEINNGGIDGDIVEIGVYKGGSMLSMILANGESRNRKFYLYDTFSDMTTPSEYDYDLNGYSANILMEQSESVKCISTLEEVNCNIQRHISEEQHTRIKYVIGDICKNTLYPDKIAILRLDTDFYESTAFELAHFYPLVSSGGYIIIDDYGHWKGCRKAVDEFLVSHPDIKLHTIDYTGVYFIKL